MLFVATVVKTHIMVFHLPYLKWFKDNGYEVHVCARNDYENKKNCNIPYCDKYFDLSFERSPFKIRNFYVYMQLKKIIETNNYDIIHCHTPMGGVLARLAARKSRKIKTKVIYTAHGFHFFKGAPLINWLLYYPVERYLARYTDVLITINKEDFNRAKKFKAKTVEYVPGVGINIDKFTNVIIDKDRKREELGISKNSIVLLSVGEIIKRKNHQTVIKALSKVNDSNVIYLICGSGELDEYLKNLANKLHLEDRVKFLGFREDIHEICSISDVFVFPSYQEGLPVALMEAMAAGLPVVCSNIRGNTDLVESEKSGYLVNPKNIDGFAAAIEKLLNNEELRIELGQYNKEIIEKFRIESVLEKVIKIYEKCFFSKPQSLQDNSRGS